MYRHFSHVNVVTLSKSYAGNFCVCTFGTSVVPAGSIACVNGGKLVEQL